MTWDSSRFDAIRNMEQIQITKFSENGNRAIEKICNNLDRAQRRERIATAVLNGLLVCNDAMAASELAIKHSDQSRSEWFAEQAVQFADDLIAELDKETK